MFALELAARRDWIRALPGIIEHVSAMRRCRFFIASSLPYVALFNGNKHGIGIVSPQIETIWKHRFQRQETAIFDFNVDNMHLIKRAPARRANNSRILRRLTRSSHH